MNVRIQANFNRITAGVQTGFARGLTQTAKAAQAESVRAVQSSFTVRGPWWQESNRFGIKVSAANKTDLAATMYTNAEWLTLHETGGTKTPRGADLTIPTADVRRNKRDIVTRGQRPRGLGAKAFRIQTSTGPALVQRMKRGPDKGRLRYLYWLEPTVKIKKRPSVQEPALKKIERVASSTIATAIREALGS